MDAPLLLLFFGNFFFTCDHSKIQLALNAQENKTAGCGQGCLSVVI